MYSSDEYSPPNPGCSSRMLAAGAERSSLLDRETGSQRHILEA